MQGWRIQGQKELEKHSTGIHVAQQLENNIYKNLVLSGGEKSEYEWDLTHTVISLQVKADDKNCPNVYKNILKISKVNYKELEFAWFVEVPNNNSLASFLVGSVYSLVKLSEQENTYIEYQYRTANHKFHMWLVPLRRRVEIDLENFTIDNQTKIRRKLQYFNNNVDLPSYWNQLQTHIFGSYPLTFEQALYQQINSAFVKHFPDGEILNIKILQHLKNYVKFFYGMKEESIAVMFLGTLILARKVVLGDFKLEAKQMQASKKSSAAAGAIDRLSEDIRVADEDAYLCKTGNPRKQILCCLCSPGRVVTGEVGDFPVSNGDSIQYPLQLKSSETTTAYLMNISQVFPAFFIEYKL